MHEQDRYYIYGNRFHYHFHNIKVILTLISINRLEKPGLSPSTYGESLSIFL